MGISQGVETMGCAVSNEPTLEAVFARLDAYGDGKIDIEDLKAHFVMESDQESVSGWKECVIKQSAWCTEIRKSIRSKYDGTKAYKENGQWVVYVPERQAKGKVNPDQLEPAHKNYFHLKTISCSTAEEEEEILCKLFHSALDSGILSRSDEFFNVESRFTDELYGWIETFNGTTGFAHGMMPP